MMYRLKTVCPIKGSIEYGAWCASKVSVDSWAYAINERDSRMQATIEEKDDDGCR